MCRSAARRVGDVALRRASTPAPRGPRSARLGSQYAPDETARARDHDPLRHVSRVWHAGPALPGFRADSPVAWADARSPVPHRCRGRGSGGRHRHRRGVGQDPVLRDPASTTSSSAALGGGGEDGAIDILLVGMDSRTDAHGNPLSAEELATLRAGDDVSTNTDTIILVRIPNNGKSATAISIPRDSYVEAPGPRQDEDQRRLRPGAAGEDEGARREAGRGPAVAEPRGHRGRPRGADQDRGQPDRRHRRPLRRDRPARLRADHRRPRRRRRLPQGRLSTNRFRVPTSLRAGRSWTARRR